MGNLRFDLNTLIETGDKSKADKKATQQLKKDFLVKVRRSLAQSLTVMLFSNISCA